MGKKNKKNVQANKDGDNRAAGKAKEEQKAQEVEEQVLEQQTPKERAEEYRRNQMECYNQFIAEFKEDQEML